jgi:hypothetical protein
MRLLKAIAIISVLALIVAATYSRSETSYTCLDCRATLTKRRICGIPSEEITPNKYSEFVLAHNSSHQHKWCWCGSEHTYTLSSVSFGCGRQHPIWQLPVSIQERYSQLVSESELHDTLRVIDSSNREAAESAVNQAYERVLDAQLRAEQKRCRRTARSRGGFSCNGTF